MFLLAWLTSLLMTQLCMAVQAEKDHINLANDLTNDLSNIVNWVKQWLVSFNSSKTKLLSFHQNRESLELPAIIMNDVSLEEKKYIDKLLGLKIHTRPKME